MDPKAEEGRLGEQFVMDWLLDHKYDAKFSDDPFDQVRDIILNGKNVEIKTQTPYARNKVFTVRENQTTKIKNADIVVFVSVPHDKYHTETDGKVYFIAGKDITTKLVTTKEGRNMVGIPFDNPKLYKLFDLTEDQIKQLKSFAYSGY